MNHPGEFSDEEVGLAPAPQPGELSDADVGLGTAPEAVTATVSDMPMANNVPRQVGAGDRFMTNLGEAFEQTLVGQRVADVQSGRLAGRTAGDIDTAISEARAKGSPIGLDFLGGSRPSPYATVPVEELEKQRGSTWAAAFEKGQQFDQSEAENRQQRNIVPFYEAGDTLADKIVAGAAALAGQVAGSAPSPESLVPAGRGATLLATAGKGAVVNAGVNAAVDPAIQAGQADLGRQKEVFDPLQYLGSVALGGVVGGGVNAAPQAARQMAGWVRNMLRTGEGKPTTGTGADEATGALARMLWNDETTRGAFEANGIASPEDLAARGRPVLDRLLANKEVRDRMLEFRQSVPDSGKVGDNVPSGRERAADPERDPSTLPYTGYQKPQTPEVITPPAFTGETVARGDVRAGQAKAGAGGEAVDPGVRAGYEANRGAATVEQQALPAPGQETRVNPQPMTEAEVAIAQAKMRETPPARIGDQPPAEPPPRMVAPEGRQPQTPDQVAEQRQAGGAFDLAERQRARAGADVRDTQPPARPEGTGERPVYLDQDFPVEILERRMVPDAKGNMTEVARVRRYDPRTGAAEADGVEYDVPVRQLKQKNYAADPRMAQDFAQRAQGPGNPEQPRSATGPVTREADQTYRTTPEDPLAPGAEGPASGPRDRGPIPRSPRPEQPDGEGPFRRYSTFEEAVRDFEERARARTERGETGPDERTRYEDQKASNQAREPDRDGRFVVDDNGYVMSTSQGPVRFSDQKQAARWILNKGQKLSPDQVFEIANHPSGKGFTVRERGRTEPPPGGGGPKGGEAPGKSGTNAGDNPPRAGGPRELPPPRVARQEGPQQPDPFVDVNSVERDLGKQGRGRHGRPAATPLRPEKPPPSLAQMVAETGVARRDIKQIEDATGERGWAGLHTKPKGLPIDDLRHKAIEQGYLPEGATISDFLSAWRRDIGARQAGSQEARVFSGKDAEALEAWRETRAYNDQVDELADRFGIETEGLSEDQFWRIANERMGFEERAELQREIVAARQAEFDEAVAAHQAEVEARGDAWEPEKVYDPGQPRSLADLERTYGEAPEPRETDYGAKRPEDQAATGDRGSGERGAGRDRSEGNGSDPQRQADVAEGAGDVRKGDRPVAGAEAPGDGGFGFERRAAKPLTTEQERLSAATRGRQKTPVQQEGGTAGPLFGEGQTTVEGFISKMGELFRDNRGELDVRALADGLRRVAGWAEDQAIAFANSYNAALRALRGAADRGSLLDLVRHARDVFLYSNEGRLHSIEARIRKEGGADAAAAVREIREMFFARPGTQDNAVGRTYHQALEDKFGEWLNRLEKASDFLRKLPNAEQDRAWDQIGRLVRNPGAITPGTPIHDAAATVGKLLREALVHARGAGMEIGDQGRGFFPRVYDTARVLNDPQRFVRDATAAFRAMGDDLAGATAKAEEWLSHIRMGDLGVKVDGGDFAIPVVGRGRPNFEKARTFSEGVFNQHLKGWVVDSPADVLPTYFHRLVQRAEWTRRMGPELEKWEALKARIVNGGGDRFLSDVVDAIASATGQVGTLSGNAHKAAALGGMWTNLTLLRKATFSSLSEPALAAARTGNILDAVRSYRDTLRQWVPILRKTSEGQRELRDLAEHLGLAGRAMDSLIMAQRFGGGQFDTRFTNMMNSKFFRFTGLTQYTDASRVAQIGIGQSYIWKQAKDAARPDAMFHRLAKDNMRELGISDAEMVRFRDWLQEHGGTPSWEALAGDEGMAALYRTALSRFTDQIIMRPNAALRPSVASTPLGRMIYALQSYNYTVTKNVLGRLGNRAVTATTKPGYNVAERAAMLAPIGLAAGLAIPIQYGLSHLYDALWTDPAKQKKPEAEEDAQRLARAISRSGMLGAADYWVNLIAGARFQKDPATALVGPLPGLASETLGAAIRVTSDRNSPGTNTMERKLGRLTYDMLVAPSLELALMAGTPHTTAAGLLLGGAGIQAIGHPATRDTVLTGVLGPAQKGGKGAGRPTR